jgi:hypothetical protein
VYLLFKFLIDLFLFSKHHTYIMSDTQEMDEFFSEISQEEEFKNAQYHYLPDYNNGAYTSLIKFDTLSLQSDVANLEYFAVPIKLAETNASFSTLVGNMVVLKGSSLSLISGVQVFPEQGTLVDDNTVQFINNRRLEVENNDDWAQSEGVEIMYSKDTSNNRDPNEFSVSAVTDETYSVTATSGAVTAAPTAAASGALVVVAGCNFPTQSSTSTAGTGIRNASFNKGFRDRVIYLWNNRYTSDTTQTTSAMYFWALIPCSHLHDWFRQSGLTFGHRWKINLLTAFGNDTRFHPMLVGGTSATNASYPPTVSIDTGHRCYLVYRKVTPPLRFLKQLETNAIRKVNFLSTETTVFSANTTANFNETITTSIVNPRRVWVELHQAGSLAYATSKGDNTSQETTKVGYCYPATAIGRITNAQIMVDGKPYFENTVGSTVGQLEPWRMLQEQFPNKGQDNMPGSLINYNDFLTTKAIYCFDISRVGGLLKVPNKPVSIGVKFTRIAGNYSGAASTDSMDIIVMIEREMVAEIDHKKGTAKVLEG